MIIFERSNEVRKVFVLKEETLLSCFMQNRSFNVLISIFRMLGIVYDDMYFEKRSINLPN